MRGGDFWFFKHLNVIENRRLDLMPIYIGDCVLGDWIEIGDQKGDQGKAAPNPIVYFLSH